MTLTYNTKSENYVRFFGLGFSASAVGSSIIGHYWSDLSPVQNAVNVLLETGLVSLTVYNSTMAFKRIAQIGNVLGATARAS
jgi:hypothetical protein